MTHKAMRFMISAIAAAGVVLHVAFPHVVVDGVSVTLILVSIVPWLPPLFKSLELPGRVKLEFQEVEKVVQRAEAAGLLAPTADPLAKEEPAFVQVASRDPNLALAGLRIELERRLEDSLVREVTVKSHGVSGACFNS
jgi:hypothetical protein